jgi:hypothetical protein
MCTAADGRLAELLASAQMHLRSPAERGRAQEYRATARVVCCSVLNWATYRVELETRVGTYTKGLRGVVNSALEAAGGAVTEVYGRETKAMEAVIKVAEQKLQEQQQVGGHPVFSCTVVICSMLRGLSLVEAHGAGGVVSIQAALERMLTQMEAGAGLTGTLMATADLSQTISTPNTTETLRLTAFNTQRG